MRKSFLLLFSLISGWQPLVAQDSTRTETTLHKPVIRLFTEMAFSGSTASRTPFWLQTNRFGIVPCQSPFASLRAGVFAEHAYGTKNPDDQHTPNRKQMSWGYGFELVGNGASKSGVLVPEAYLKGRFRSVELLIGRRRDIVGLSDSTLGSGSYSWSGNALPIPKIQLSLPDYTPLGFTKGLLAFRGMYVHGWFGNKGVVTHSYLHQKALYGRLGKPHWAIKFYAGFNHQVQWAGRSEVITDNRLIRNGRFPTGFKNYLNVISGISLPAQHNAIDTTQYNEIDRGNRVGNHLGTIDIGFELARKGYSLLVYRQSVYEDGSLFYLTNISDGLNGIRFRNKNSKTGRWHFQTIVLEFLYTRSQGGSIFSTENKKRGADNYFNHSQYIDGWSYRGRTIGTPFIPPANTTNPNLPRALADGLPVFTNNNRLRALHLGLEGSLNQVYQFEVKSTLSDNYGTYNTPFSEKVRQFSSIASVSFPVKWLNGMQATASIAADFGKLYSRNTGLFLSLRKNWL